VIVCAIIGIPLILYGGLNIPYSLTKEEAYAAGTRQLEVLEEKRKNSVEYKEMLIGAGFFGTSMAMLGMCLITVYCCPKMVIEPDESPPPSTPNAVP
jgi:hypothetical protein